MARLQQHGLRRSVGVPGLFATAYGNVGSSIYYALGLVAAHAIGLTPVVFVLAGGLFALTAKSYAEGAAMFPEAGGASSFARHAFNEVVSFFAGWALSLDYLLTIALSAFSVPHYLGAFWPALDHNPGDVVGGLVVVAVLALLNVRGLGESAKLNVVLAVADLATQVLLVVVGAFLVLDPARLVSQVHLGTSPSWSQVVFALSLAMLAYTGIETVSNMAEEAKDPGRDVPRAVNLVLVAVLGVYAGISVIALSALPVVHGATALGSRYANDPILGVVSTLGLGSGPLAILRGYVGVLAATILLIATNAGLIGISRLSWSLAEHRQLPGLFARLHRRYRTPWFTIAVFSVLAGLLIIPGQTDFLGNLYSFGAMLSFTTAHVAVVALRWKEPDRERPYRIRGNLRVRGRELPVSALVGGAGTFAAWISVVALHAEARLVGVPWMVLGLGGYVLYRRRLGLDPRERARLGRPKRLVEFRELSYGSALVPIFGTDVSARALRAAAKLVGEGARVHAVFVLQVPSQLPLDASLREEERQAREVLESARTIGARERMDLRTSVLRTRHAGRTLADEARRLQADVVFLDAVHAPPSERALGPTASLLLAERPCRVVIETAPASAAVGSAGAGRREPRRGEPLVPARP